MTNFFPIFRLFILRLLLLSAVGCGICALQRTAVAAPHPKPVYFDLPEITTAMSRDYQLIVQATLRLPGPIAENQVRENLIKLRHELVLSLSDIDPRSLTADSIELIADNYAHAANLTLNKGKPVMAVWFQTFVVQEK